MNANGRRARQAANGYKHIHAAKRPHYKMRSKEAGQARMEAQRKKEQAMKARGWKG